MRFTLSQLIEKDSKEYMNVPLEALSLSDEINRTLSDYHIETVFSLLQTDLQTVKELLNFDIKAVMNLLDKINSINPHDYANSKSNNENDRYSVGLLQNDFYLYSIASDSLKKAALKKLSIDSIGLSIRSKNALHRNGIHTIDTLLYNTKYSLYSLRNLGSKSIDEIIDIVKKDSTNNLVDSVDNSDGLVETLHENENCDENTICDSIDSLNLSNRANNALHRNGIHKIQELLSLKVEDLYSFRNLGNKTVSEIIEKVNSVGGFRSTGDDNIEQTIINKRVKDLLPNGFSVSGTATIELLGLSPRAFNSLKRNGVITLNELINTRIDELQSFDSLGKKSFNEIIIRLNTIADVEVARVATTNELFNKAIDTITTNNYEMSANKYVAAYKHIREDAKFEQFDERMTIIELLHEMQNDFKDIYSHFVSWIINDIDYYSLAKDVIDGKHFSNERRKSIIEQRIEGKTLEEVSDVHGITRERVRQIENKFCNELYRKLMLTNLLPHLLIEGYGDGAINVESLENYFHEYSNIVFYTIRSLNIAPVIYWHKNDLCFLYRDKSYINKIESFIKSLPLLIKTDEMYSYLSLGNQMLGLNDKTLNLLILTEYSFASQYYIKHNIQRSHLLEVVLKVEFSNGIHVYDESELDLFRSYIHEYFGNVKIPNNNRALIASIVRVSVLCGRGIYKVKEDQYIPEELKDRIYNYICKSKLCLLNSIYETFKTELNEYGIDNKYYLHGVLRELLNDRLFFKRDYVSTSEKFTNIYNEIVSYIRKSKAPVSKNQIKQHFKGITDIMIQFATDDSSILNYFGNYVHADNLNIRDIDYSYFGKVMS